MRLSAHEFAAARHIQVGAFNTLITARNYKVFALAVSAIRVLSLPLSVTDILTFWNTCLQLDKLLILVINASKDDFNDFLRSSKSLARKFLSQLKTSCSCNVMKSNLDEFCISTAATAI